MNSSGYPIENYHTTDTFVDGSLTVDGQIFVRDTEGQSEYLDSGDYNPIVLGVPTHWNSLSLKSGTQARYAKNGNIVEVYMELTGELKANQAFAQISITVPSVDLFDKKHTGSAYSDSVFILSSGAQVYNCTEANITTSGGGSTSVLLNYDSYITSNPVSLVDFFLNITYKLDGVDVPASAIIQGGGGSGSDVRNPMIETLNGGGFDIINVANIQANSVTAPNVVTNPLTVALDANSKDINNIININGVSGSNMTINSQLDEVIISGSKLELRTNLPTAGNVEVYTNIDVKDNIIKGCSELNSQNGDLIIKGLTSGGTFPASKIGLEAFKVDLSQCPSGLDMGNNAILTNGTITTNDLRVLNIDGRGGANLNITEPDFPVVITGSSLELRTNPPGGVVETYADIDMKTNKDIINVGELKLNTLNSNAGNISSGSNIDFNNNNILQVGNLQVDTVSSQFSEVRYLTTLNMNNNNIISAVNISSFSDMTILATPTGLLTIGTVANHKYSNTSPNNGLIEQYTQRLEEHTNILDKIDTVHIYDANGFNESIVNIGGVDYYSLLDNCTYIIHDQITLTRGFNFGNNSAIKGESLASSITFDESANDICGFRSDNQHLFVSDITIIGGGGHFTSSTANVKGLFDFSNFNTGAPAPFYGRNKRCRIQNVQIIAPYSLGKLQGGGTLRLLGNFINGGGAVPASVYTEVGLEVSDGLSFEFCNNKVVLFRGAQGASTCKMLNFVNATLSPVVLGFNAVIISGNIMHPRDAENAINFENNSITQLGSISANTFIRTGGTAPLINYERATIDDNYNKSAVINYEVNGNAGVLDVLPTCLINATTSNNVSSASYIDIPFPISNVSVLQGSKRFGIKAFATGVSGGIGNYTTGNYIRDTTNANKYAYILNASVVLAGTDSLVLLDFNDIFTSGTTYEEIDKDFNLTGVVSTGFNYGTSGGEIEMYYGDKDPADLQIVTSISHNNSGTNDEVQFIMTYDDGSGYVQDTTTQISVTNPRANPRSNTSTITALRRFKKGDTFKFLYRYVDVTTSIIDNITITVH